MCSFSLFYARIHHASSIPLTHVLLILFPFLCCVTLVSILFCSYSSCTLLSLKPSSSLFSSYCCFTFFLFHSVRINLAPVSSRSWSLFLFPSLVCFALFPIQFCSYLSMPHPLLSLMPPSSLSSSFSAFFFSVFCSVRIHLALFFPVPRRCIPRALPARQVIGPINHVKPHWHSDPHLASTQHRIYFYLSPRQALKSRDRK